MLIRVQAPSSRKGKALIIKRNRKHNAVMRRMRAIMAIWGRGDSPGVRCLSTHYRPRA
jgi:hypothetical protein